MTQKKDLLCFCKGGPLDHNFLQWYMLDLSVSCFRNVRLHHTLSYQIASHSKASSSAIRTGKQAQIKAAGSHFLYGRRLQYFLKYDLICKHVAVYVSKIHQVTGVQIKQMSEMA